MKSLFYSTVVVAWLGYAAAAHAHQKFHLNPPRHLERESAKCGCTTTYTTFFGEPTCTYAGEEPSTVTIANTEIAVIQPMEQKPLIIPQPSSTSAATYALSTSILPSSTSVYVAPSSTSSYLELSQTAKPASKSSEGTSSDLEKKPVSSPASSPASSSSSSPSSSPSSKPAAAKPPKSSTGTSGSSWSMAYSPYSADGSCKNSASVSVDVKSIAAKGFSAIRLYSTDCSGLLNVGSVAKECGLNLILGVFISATGISAAEGQISEIVSWAAGDWRSVEMIVIGNEAVFNQFASAKDLADFICRARDAFKKAGYTGPVTTTEPLSILSDNAGLLCPVLDVAAANIHPFFNSGTTAQSAGEFVARELKLLESICPGLPAYNLETGWPSAGTPNGAAIPGIDEQIAAIESIQKAAGGNSVFFSFVDDLWKSEGAFGV